MMLFCNKSPQYIHKIHCGVKIGVLIIKIACGDDEKLFFFQRECLTKGFPENSFALVY